MAEQSQERTEQATPRRQQKAREEGQIARSRELNTTFSLLTASGGLLVMGSYILDGIETMMVHGLTWTRAELLDPATMITALISMFFQGMRTVTPLMLLLVVVTLLSPMLLGGWSFSSKSMAFKFDKLDPIKGLGKIFKMRTLVELGKALAKFVLILVVGLIVFKNAFNELIGLSTQPLLSGLGRGFHIVGYGFLFLSMSMILIALVDVPYQLWDNKQEMKMTKQEVRDDTKETDGDPLLKGKIRSQQREMAQRRMMTKVPEADVIVTNPTHFAVALRYDAETMGTPVLLAKGADFMALQIRKVARDVNIPQVEAPLLARALYHSTELNQPIPESLFLAVAQVLAYVFQLRSQHRSAADSAVVMNDLPVPPELLRQSPAD
ncbi:MAG TPA: flagellar biosynthesis protein FlhB [Gammaproteobacteria bacterium]|nr:flagellar biosynthesis protein FlhB [Gammaproteobacteria bacterium]